MGKASSAALRFAQWFAVSGLVFTFRELLAIGQPLPLSLTILTSALFALILTLMVAVNPKYDRAPNDRGSDDMYPAVLVAPPEPRVNVTLAPAVSRWRKAVAWAGALLLALTSFLAVRGEVRADRFERRASYVERELERIKALLKLGNSPLDR